MDIKNHEPFKKSKILIIGDAMLDKYFLGSTERISPEALFLF